MSSSEIVYPIIEEDSRAISDETRMQTIKRVLTEKANEEAELVLYHPWVRIVTNWIIWLLLAILIVYCIVAGIKKAVNDRDEKIANNAVSDYAAEQQAAAEEQKRKEEAAAKTEAALMEQEAQDCAKALYGIRLFDEKYQYTDNDLRTYLRSAFNRVDAMGYTNNEDRQKKLHEVLFGGQYLASSETNTVQTRYLEVSRKAVKEWHEETAKPCDFSYQFAELLERVTLVTSTNPSGYDRRWWYQG